MQNDSEIYQAKNSFYRKDADNHAIASEATLYLAPVGLLLNAMFLYVVARIRSMRSIVNVYLGNLAVADSIYLACVLISKVGAVPVAAAWPWVVVRCITALSTVASYLIVTALAVERYTAICQPFAMRAASSKTRAAKRLAVIWTVALIVGSGYDSVFHLDGGATSQTIVIALLLILFTVGLIINAALYSGIVKKLRQQPQMTSTADHQQRLRRVVLMLIVNTALFFILNITNVAQMIFHLVLLWSDTSLLSTFKTLPSFSEMTLVRYIFALISCSVDPLVYSGANSDYRAAVVQAFSCLNPKCCRCSFRKRKNCPQQPAGQIGLQEILIHHDTPQQPAQQIELQEIHHGQDTPQQPAQQMELQEILHSQDPPQQPAQQIELQEICHGQDTQQQPAQQIELQEIPHGQDTPQQPAQQIELQEICHGQDTPQQPAQQIELQEIHPTQGIPQIK